MPAKRFPRTAAATPHYLASAAALETFARGGNAVDAAIAGNLALGVVAPYFCGYGGDLFAIVWDGELHGYLGSGRSSSTVDVEAARAAGSGEMPILGPHAVTVPGAIAGWFDLHERWGSLPFAELAAPALRYARDGFELTPMGAQSFEWSCLLYEGYDDLLAAYRGLEAGDVVRQPELARTIELLVADGPDAYYRGPIAAAIAETTQGTLAAGDLAAHTGRWAAPLRARYRDIEVAELPPPTQGVTALEAFRIVDGFDLPLPADGVERQHLLLEAMKLALADRDAHVTDPDAMRVLAADLLDDAWIGERRAAIDPERAITPPALPSRLGGTAYLCFADADGLLVSLIQSNFLSLGSGVRVREWGINLNNRGSSFTLDPDHVNTLASSKLPMHTLIPAMALRDGRPELVFGSMGADAQAQVHLQVLTRIVDDGADPQDALDAPRWRVEPSNWQVRAERGFDRDWFDAMAARGHALERGFPGEPGFGHAHAIAPTPGGYAVATDPRAEGAALGF